MGSRSVCTVTVIILHWNRLPFTLRCLEAVYASSYDAFQVVVVDNNSGDDSVAAIQGRYPGVIILENSENLGYAGGNNVGIRYALEAGADYVLLLNDDAVVAPDMLAALVSAAGVHPEAGIWGPKVCVLEDPQRILSAGRTQGGAFEFAHRGMGELDQGQYGQLTEVDALSGCALLAHRRVTEAIGMLDERFFAYGEDTDWCYRARQAGFKLLYVPEARVWHPDTRNRDANAPLVTYYTCRNNLLFVAKHRLGVALTIRILVGYLRTLSSWTLRPRWRYKCRERDALLRAIVDFARGRFGRAEGFS